MKGLFYIDGENALTRYSLSIAEGGYNGLVSFPTLKKFDINDWDDQNGVEPDLSELHFDSREISIKFNGESISGTMEFVDKLTTGVYHQFRFEDLGITLNMRLESQPALNTMKELHIFSLKFIVDASPLKDYTYEAPQGKAIDTGYALDALDFAKYGIKVLWGSDKEILKVPAIKKNCQVNSDTIDGSLYYAGEVFYAAKDVSLSLLMQVPTMDIFWRNWKALLYNLTQPEGRILKYDFENYAAFYKSGQTKEFHIDSEGHIWWKFNLVLCFYDFRINP